MSWRYFTREEVTCKCGCNRADMDADFMEELDRIREAVGFALVVSSGFRCPEHNRRVSKTRSLTGPHTTGLAVDLKLWGAKANRVLEEAVKGGVICGYGFAQRGNHSRRFLHLDAVPNSYNHPRPWLWSY